MHLLYLDDAGSMKNSDESYIVLGGVSVFESEAFRLTQELDNLAATIDPVNPAGIEFHASEIFARRTAPWNKYSREQAQGIIKSVLNILARSPAPTYAFSCALHKASFGIVTDYLGLAFEDMCKRFDIYLDRLNIDGDRQRGLLILDESSHETVLQNMAINFRKMGTQWGVIKNLADIPFFVNSKASRIIQLADHIAYAVFRRYNAGDNNYFDLIAHKFYSHGGVLHGLAHKQKKPHNCMCPACISRKLQPSFTEE